MARVCGEEAWGVTSASGWEEGAKCRFGAKFSDVASHEQAPRVPTRLAQGGRTGSGGRCVGTTLEVRRRFLWRMFARSASRSDASTGREGRYNNTPPVQGCDEMTIAHHHQRQLLTAQAIQPPGNFFLCLFTSKHSEQRSRSSVKAAGASVAPY